MDITKFLPNIFGQAAPSYLPGLLGAEETQNLQNRANVQGLLGAGLALAQGMSRTGVPRSAAENILGAIAGGFGAAGGAYDQGIKNYVTQQQIAQTQLAQQDALLKRQQTMAQQGAIEQLLKSPEIAGDPLKVAYIRANPNEALKILSEQLPLQQAISGGQVQTAPQAAPQVAPQVAANVPAGQEKPLPGVTTTAIPGPDALLQQDKNRLIDENRRIAGLTSEQAQKRRKENLDQIAAIDKQLDRFAVSGYNFDTVKKSVSDKFKPQIDAIKQLAETQALGADQVRIAIQEVFKQSQESERGQRIEGLPGEFAQMRFGTMDRTKLEPNQLEEVLRFANAPNADQLATLQRAAIDTQFTTGRAAPIPSGREQFIVPGQRVSPQTAVEQQATPQVVAPTQVVPTQTAQVVPRTAPQTQVTPQVVPQAQVTQTVAPENAPAETKNLYSYNKNALINKSDRDYSPAKKQILREKQAPLQSAVTYSLTSIKDARDAAQSLKNNPQYIDALTGRFSPLLSGTVGGVVVNQNAKTANDLLQNILTRSFVKEIQQMREASPTGGAVGSVTEKEMDALSKVSASLSVGMNKDEFIKQLDNYLAISNRSLKNIPTEYSKTYGYNGEFDEILTTPGVSTTRTSGKTQVELELQRRKKGNQ
jgi:hypothetical protein